ncbi:MAG: signal recognition particle receptor subunit alpha [archaeon]
MVLDKLGSSLRDALRKIARSGYVDKETLESTVKEIQRALLSSDVNVKLVSQISDNIKKRAADEKPKAGFSKREHIVNIVYEELTNALAGESDGLKLNDKGQTKIMLCGLFGSGKTTTTAKLGKYLTKKGLKVALIGTDIWRPAAFEQLKQLGEEGNMQVYGGGKDAMKALKEGMKAAKDADVVIVDSAGRDAVDKELTAELKKLNKELNPDEKILVVPADLGQKAAEVAKGFEEMVGIDGVILTKLESSAKGGGALSACAELKVPIKFVGLGERIGDFEEFNPTKFVSKLLGMGDLETLVKKTQEIFEGASKDQMEAMMKGRFNLKDLYAQIQSMKKMGPLSKVMEMLPMGVNIPKDQMNLSQERMEKFIWIMDSMTPQELEEPDVIDGARVQRVAAGSGRSVEEVRALIKQYNMTKKLVKKFGKNKRNMNKLMKQMGAGKMQGM